MTGLFPHRANGWREVRIDKAANGNADHLGPKGWVPKQGGAAGRTKMLVEGVAGCAGAYVETAFAADVHFFL